MSGGSSVAAPLGRGGAGARRRWRPAGLALLGLVLVMLSASLEVDPRLQSQLHLGSGILATVAVLFGILYPLRRRVPGLALRWRIGHASLWLRLHLMVGWLLLVLVLVHTRLHWPNGGLHLWLLALVFWLVLSGQLGRGLQRVVPRVLTATLRTEVLPHRAPEIRATLAQRGDALAAGSGEVLAAAYATDMAPILKAPAGRFRDLRSLFEGARRRRRHYAHLRPLLEHEDEARLVELEALLEARTEMEIGLLLQGTLRSWLWLHVPAAVVLLVLIAFHILQTTLY